MAHQALADAALRDIIEQALQDSVELFELPDSLRRSPRNATSERVLQEVVKALGSISRNIYPTSSDLTGKER